MTTNLTHGGTSVKEEHSSKPKDGEQCPLAAVCVTSERREGLGQKIYKKKKKKVSNFVYQKDKQDLSDFGN